MAENRYQDLSQRIKNREHILPPSGFRKTSTIGVSSMKKVYRLKNLGCANCAAKMERAINKLEGISCSIAFMTARMTLEYENEPDLDRIQSIINKFEKNCEIIR